MRAPGAAACRGAKGRALARRSASRAFHRSRLPPPGRGGSAVADNRAAAADGSGGRSSPTGRRHAPRRWRPARRRPPPPRVDRRPGRPRDTERNLQLHAPDPARTGPGRGPRTISCAGRRRDAACAAPCRPAGRPGRYRDRSARRPPQGRAPNRRFHGRATAPVRARLQPSAAPLVRSARRAGFDKGPVHPSEPKRSRARRMSSAAPGSARAGVSRSSMRRSRSGRAPRASSQLARCSH